MPLAELSTATDNNEETIFTVHMDKLIQAAEICKQCKDSVILE